MKLLLLAMMLSGARETFVYDEANILGQDGVKLEAMLREYEHATSYELVVVTAPTLNGLSIENYTSMRWGQLGVGKRETNNGVMLVCAGSGGAQVAGAARQRAGEQAVYKRY